MIKIFYNLNGQAEVSESLGILKKITLEDALWLDLFNPTGEEKRAVESFLHTTLQSRAQAEEIESSSRYSETVDAIFANTNFLIPSAENYTMESVSFVLTGHTITSIRQVPLRSFTDIQRRILFNSLYRSNLHIQKPYRYFAYEAGGIGIPRFSVYHSLTGAGNGEFLPCSGDRHIAKPPLLFHRKLIVTCHRGKAREKPLLDPRHIDIRKLQALCIVHRHNEHLIALIAFADLIQIVPLYAVYAHKIRYIRLVRFLFINI